MIIKKPDECAATMIRPLVCLRRELFDMNEYEGLKEVLQRISLSFYGDAKMILSPKRVPGLAASDLVSQTTPS